MDIEEKKLLASAIKYITAADYVGKQIPIKIQDTKTHAKMHVSNAFKGEGSGGNYKFTISHLNGFSKFTNKITTVVWLCSVFWNS